MAGKTVRQYRADKRAAKAQAVAAPAGKPAKLSAVDVAKAVEGLDEETWPQRKLETGAGMVARAKAVLEGKTTGLTVQDALRMLDAGTKLVDQALTQLARGRRQRKSIDLVELMLARPDLQEPLELIADAWEQLLKQESA
jgi:hypothetical protein